MLIAKKDYEPGDVILTEEPLIYILASDQRRHESSCDSCLKKFDSLKACSGCRFVQYCSKECQKKDWKGHHKYEECKVFKVIRDESIAKMENVLLYLSLPDTSRTA